MRHIHIHVVTAGSTVVCFLQHNNTNTYVSVTFLETEDKAKPA